MQAEGGALLNGALAAADLIDELNLTISPQLAGGDGPRVTGGVDAADPADAPGPGPGGRRLLVHPLRTAPLNGVLLGRCWLQLLQQHQFALEVGGSIEVLVDAGEAQIGHVVEARNRSST